MCHSLLGSKEESFSMCCMGLSTTGAMETIDVIPGWIRNDMNHMPQDLLEEFRILMDELLRALGNIDRRWAQFPRLRQRAVGLFQLVLTMGKMSLLLISLILRCTYSIFSCLYNMGGCDMAVIYEVHQSGTPQCLLLVCLLPLFVQIVLISEVPPIVSFLFWIF